MADNEQLMLNDDSFEITEVGPDELINIKKVPKYKEVINYIKGEVLGKGSFGTVREFIHKNSLERFAVKIIKIERIAKMGKTFETDVKEEMRLCRKLNHSNVMRMVEIHSTEKKIYIFMEYCAGVLSEFIESAPLKHLPKWQSHHYFCQLIEGLKYIHSKGMFHRDIKPDNLLVNNSDVIKIADFGQTCAISAFALNDLISGFEGSRLYQPPELFLPDIELYSGSKFDIWSSGVLLFKMISGIYPYLNEDKADIYDPNAYNDITYPEMIRNDLQLLNLFQRIFVIDFNERITVREMKTHSWFVMNEPRIGSRVNLPHKQCGDIYRSLNVLQRIRVKYYPQTDEEKNPNEVVFCNENDYIESRKTKVSNILPNRVRVSRSPRRRRTPIRRLIQLGLYRR